jgi:tetratricopeptide (TPR) repeat protein
MGTRTQAVGLGAGVIRSGCRSADLERRIRRHMTKAKLHSGSISGFGLRPMPIGVGLAKQANPELIATLFAEGFKLHQAGRLVEAEGLYNQVLALRPEHFDCLHLRGVICHQRGSHAEAVRWIDQALKQNPNHAGALNNRGTALSAQNRLAEALESFSRAATVQQDFAEAHSNRSIALRQLGRFAEALASCDRALKLRPDYAEAHSNRGLVLCRLQRFDDALASSDCAIALRPNFAEAHSNRSIALRELRRFEEALASCDRAIALMGDFAEAHCNRGNVLSSQKRFTEALQSYDRAISLRPDFAEAHCNRGNALRDLRRLEQAMASYNRAIELQPDFAQVFFNRGIAFEDMERFDDALQSYGRALEIRPDDADTRLNAALCRLLIGDFERGWEQYESRWTTAVMREHRRTFPQPLWLGAEEIAGKTIFLHAEQGLGDTLQFGRYVPYLVARGARVILEVQTPLRALMASLPGNPQIVADGDRLPDFDLHCPLLSLPLAFHTRLDTIPGATPYLSAPADKVNAWRDRLGPRTKPRVGLVWAGNPRKELPNLNLVDSQRSIAFATLAPLLEVTGCSFYSLQKGDDAVKQLRDSIWRDDVIDFTDDLHDFADTAALIENLDLVVSVDTSVLHVAGALAKPVWLLNRHNTCWRWLREREDSPWYPTVRQFRQDRTRDWTPVVTRVANALKKTVAI